MKILIFGVGGVGGYLGSKLETTDLDISYVARGKRFDFLKKNGLLVHSANGNINIKKIKVFKKIPEKERYDIIISTVKLYDFDNFIYELKSKIVEGSIILPFQNGIYSEQKIIDEFGEKNCYGAVAQISAYVDEKQSIIHKGKLATFFVGHLKNTFTNRLEFFSETCRGVGLDLLYKKNIQEKIWEKFIFLSAYSGITTLTKKSIGEIFETKSLKKDFINAMLETYNLSQFFNVKFRLNPVDYWLSKIKNMPYDMTSSMYVDFKNKKKLELRWLSGFIVEQSERFGTSCIVHKKILDGIESK